MRVYLDTSSLIKLYHTESGTKELDAIFQSNTVEGVFVSSLAKVEFNSALWKKVRTKDLLAEEAVVIISSFESDYSNYNFIDVTDDVIAVAKELISKYGLSGLRALDSIQLASIIKVRSQLDLAIAADELLRTLIKSVGVKTPSRSTPFEYMREFKLYDQVQLTKPLPRYHFEKGDVAIVVDVAKDKQGNKGYVLEFFDCNGETLEAVVVAEDSIIYPPPHAVVNYRPYIEA
jgi:uncharacterized protein